MIKIHVQTINILNVKCKCYNIRRLSKIKNIFINNDK